MSETFRPFNPETDPTWNREPGIVVVPGSNYANEMQKFEQFPSKYGQNPGNPYVKREFPKMVYRAQHYNGKVACMAAPPDPLEYGADLRSFQNAEESARRFTEKCQRIVKDEAELQRSREDGWRDDPKQAVEYLLGRDRAEGEAAAIRNYEDRNMSEMAKREAAQAIAEAGQHIGDVPEKPKKRRGRPPKNAAA